MKVVLFCGGLGMRLREYSESIPKPMVNIGYRPILWNVMKFYAHYGHKDFILCLGHKADMIKEYFVNYKEYISNDFVFKKGGDNLQLLNSDIDDWTITFVDTGLTSNIGQRLYRVKDYLKDEEMFLANYTDGVSDVYLPDMIDSFKKTNNVASFMAHQPTQSFHVVSIGENNMVNSINYINSTDFWINTGYFILRKEIFNYMEYGDELVVQPFHRLIKEQKLMTHKYNGFWMCMDTFKDKRDFDEMYSNGNRPWEIWNNLATNNK